MNISLSYILNTVVYVVTIIVVLYSTFRDKIREPYMKRLLASIGVFLLIAVVGAAGFIYFGPGSLGQPFSVLITSCCGFFIPYIVLDYNLGQCLFISGIVKCYADDLALMDTVLYYFVSGRMPESYLDFPAWPILAVTAVSFPFILLFFKKLMRPALDVSGFLSSWSVIWLAPFLTNLMYALYMQPVFTEVTAFPGKEFSFVPFLWVLLTFATYIILLKTLIEQSRSAMLQEELHISDIQVSAQQKQLEHLQHYIESTGKVRHDMRHHLMAMQGFAERKDFAGITEYLKEYLPAISSDTPEIYSENPAVDAILGYYRQTAVEEGVEVKITAEPVETMSVADTDICIILGNLLENAYEACSRQKTGKKYIYVNMRQAGQALVIIVENSYEGTIRKQDGAFLSSKAKFRKGIGITSILEVTKKYRGIPRFEYNGKRFRVSLLLNGNSLFRGDK